MINYYDNIKSPTVKGDIDIYTFLDCIEKPDFNELEKISNAREVYPIDKEEYNKIKSTICCYTLNFRFDEYKKTENILDSTGFIYLDVDNEIELINHELVFASWLSLSDKGRGYLIKVHGLTTDNFYKTYNEIALLIGIKVDPHANKPTQFTINSYDRDIYINNESKTYNVNLSQKHPHLSNNINRVVTQLGEDYYKLRFNNYDEVDFKGEEYMYFDTLRSFAEVFIPKMIPKGKRNNVLFNVGRQIKALNIDIGFDTLERLLTDYNTEHCKPPIPNQEISTIIDNSYSYEGEPFYNKARRYLINKSIVIGKKEQAKLRGKLNARAKTEKTITKLQNIINEWNFEELGKITQKKLKEVSGMNIKTVEKYYKYLKK